MAEPKRTQGVYILETLLVEPDESSMEYQRLQNMAARLYHKWSALGQPHGEFMVEFATRETDDAKD